MSPNGLQGTAPLERTPNQAFVPETDLERNQVRSQLQRILTSTAFSNCKRYAAVLKYVVDQTLEGSGDHLKERTIGIEVFERPPDYDTATDHAVRSAVAEVRKRLAQYYLKCTPGELQIEIQPGSYTPQFRWPDPSSYRAPDSRTAALSSSSVVVPQPVPLPAARRSSWALPGLIAAGCVIVAVIAFMATRSSGPLDSFWKPITSSNSPVLLCIGNVEGGERIPSQGPLIGPTTTLSQFHNCPVSRSTSSTRSRWRNLRDTYGPRENGFVTRPSQTPPSLTCRAGRASWSD